MMKFILDKNSAIFIGKYLLEICLFHISGYIIFPKFDHHIHQGDGGERSPAGHIQPGQAGYPRLWLHPGIWNWQYSMRHSSVTFKWVRYYFFWMGLHQLWISTFQDGIFCHFVASMISGLVTTIASMPVDTFVTIVITKHLFPLPSSPTYFKFFPPSRVWCYAPLRWT